MFSNFRSNSSALRVWNFKHWDENNLTRSTLAVKNKLRRLQHRLKMRERVKYTLRARPEGQEKVDVAHIWHFFQDTTTKLCIPYFFRVTILLGVTSAEITKCPFSLYQNSLVNEKVSDIFSSRFPRPRFNGLWLNSDMQEINPQNCTYREWFLEPRIHKHL